MLQLQVPQVFYVSTLSISIEYHVVASRRYNTREQLILSMHVFIWLRSSNLLLHGGYSHLQGYPFQCIPNLELTYLRLMHLLIYSSVKGCRTFQPSQNFSTRNFSNMIFLIYKERTFQARIFCHEIFIPPSWSLGWKSPGFEIYCNHPNTVKVGMPKRGWYDASLCVA